MQNDSKQIKYFLYARKSSESEDRQVQSIDDQINKLKELAAELDLDIKKIYTEAKSAKKPNNRPLFDEMIERIENGDAQGILCWQINRLSRNPIDSGKIQWLLQGRVLKSIRTMEREYLPDDNVLLFSVESGMANQFIIDLSKNTIRGLEGKVQRGWYPCQAPLGYLNEKLEKIIIKDPERFNLVRQMWDLMLTGSHRVSQILKIANNKWGLRTPSHKRSGGKPLSLSGLYRIFRSPFYAGIIKYRGKRYEGKHASMITIEEFERVQSLLRSKDKPKPQRHFFAFTGFIRCGECGCLITAEKKKKFIKSTGEIKYFTYYHCTRKRKYYVCSQKKMMKEEYLNEQAEQEISKITILPEFRDWSLEILRESNDREIEDRGKVYESQHLTLIKIQTELDNLTKMRYRDLINDDEFTKERNILQEQIVNLKEKLRGTETRAENWLDLAERAFQFATNARKAFIAGDIQMKKEILMALGSNPTIKDGKLNIQANEWLKPITEWSSAFENEIQRLEPNNLPIYKAQTEAFTSASAPKGGWLDAFRTVDWDVLKLELKQMSIIQI